MLNQSALINILLIAAAIMYMCYKQIVQQMISNRDFMLPLVGAVYFALLILKGTVGMDSVLFVGAGSALGVLTGFLSGSVVRVWRDNATGTLYQRGGWNYVLVLVGLLAVRILLYLVLRSSGLMIGSSPIDIALIAFAVANYLGRTINVHMRASHTLKRSVNHDETFNTVA